MSIGVLTVYLHLAECGSLKDKRSRIKPLLSRLHREFNVSTAEIGQQDQWKSSVIACAVISSDPNHNHRLLQQVLSHISNRWPDLLIVEHHIEIIQ